MESSSDKNYNALKNVHHGHDVIEVNYYKTAEKTISAIFIH